MAKLIDTFHSTDRDLIGILGISLEPQIVLERVEAGSIRAWLRTVLIGVPDEALNNLDWRPVVGRYLVRAKHGMLRWLDTHDTVSSRSELNELQEVIMSQVPTLDDMTRLLQAPMPAQRLLGSVSALSDAVGELGPGDRVTFGGGGAITPVNINLHLSGDRVEELLTEGTRRSDAELVLLVKKPDYLGRSRWEFRHDDHPIEAHIRDDDWLARFRNGLVVLRPGDALRAIVRSEVHVGFEGQIVGTRHDIIQVLGVLAGSEGVQSELLDDET